MPYLVTAVGLVGAITVLNLLLTMAVIRRLRRLESQRNMDVLYSTGLAVGAALPDFEAETITGEKMTRETLLGQESIFAFFATSCTVCKPSLAHLIEYIDQRSLKPHQAIAVVSGDEEGAAEFREPLQGKVTVVVEEPAGPVMKAFQVSGTPTFVMVDSSGTVTRSVSGSQRLISDN